MEIELLSEVVERYPAKISKYIQFLLANGRYCKEAARQFTSSAEELMISPDYSPDACNEKMYQRGRAVIHKYENRAALVLTNTCFVYCRFCFRKAIVGQPDLTIRRHELIEGLEYIRSTPEIIDVLLTGGDPLILNNRQFGNVIEELTAIEHVKVIRIDSRALNTAPERFDDELLGVFKRSGKVWYHAHLNHPDDLEQPEVLQALNRLHEAGVPVLNQFVLLRGVNDSTGVVNRLLIGCYTRKIIPYNIYLPDRTQGTEHFRLSRQTVSEVFSAISLLPGPAQPALVVVDKKNMKQRALFNDHLDLNAFLDAYYDNDRNEHCNVQ